MKKTLVIFSGLAVVSIIFLASFSGGIFVQPQISPIKEVKDTSETTMILEAKGKTKTETKKIRLDKENRLEEVRYVHYNEKRQKEWVITCEKMLPQTQNSFFIEKPHCVYFVAKKQSSGKLQLSKTYVVNADTAILKKRKKDFDLLILKKNVKVQGVSEGKIQSTATTNTLRINLTNRTLRTKAKVQLQKDHAFTIKATGMETFLKSDKVKFLQNVHLTVQKKQNDGTVTSTSQGALELQKMSQKLFIISQETQVALKSKKAKLQCNYLQIELQQNQDKKMYARKFIATGQVKFDDGKNSMRCENFQQRVLHDEERITLKKNAHIALEGKLTLLDKKEQESLQKIVDKRKAQRIEGSATQEIRWKKKYGAIVTIESVYFIGQAKIYEYLQNKSTTKIHGDYIKLDIATRLDAAKKKEKREPIYLEAKRNVMYHDKKLRAAGNYCKWKKTSPQTDTLYMTGRNNRIVFLNVSGTQSGQKSSNTDQEKKQDKKEDIQVTSRAYITVQRHSNGKHLCHSKKDVNILRYAAGTKKQIGSFKCQRLIVRLKNHKKNSDKKFVLKKAVALDDVLYRDDKIYASGQTLTWLKKDIYENIVLQKNPKVIAYQVDVKQGGALLGEKKSPQKSTNVKEDIELRAEKAIVIVKNTQDQSYLLNAKKNVDMYRYKHQTDTQVGKFKAHDLIAQIVENPKEKKRTLHSLRAKREVYIEDEGRTAMGDRLYVKTLKDNSKNIQLLGNVTLQQNKSKITGDKLFITGKNRLIHVADNVKLFAEGAQGNGDRLYYSTQKDTATLWGNPAQLQQIDATTTNPNTLFAQKIVFSQKDNMAHAYDNVKMLFSNNGKGNGLDLWGKSQKRNKKSSQKKPRNFQLTCDEAQAVFTNESDKQQRAQGDVLSKGKWKLNEFTALKNVVVTNRDDATQRGEGNKFIYFVQQKKAQLFGNKARMAHSGREIFSSQFDFYIDRKEVQGQGPIKIVLPRGKTEKKKQQLISGKTIHITSQGKITYLNEQEKIRLVDNIHATIDKRTLKCQRLEVILKKQVIQELIAYDNVILQSEKNTVYGTQLRWNETKKRVFIADYPYVRIKGEGTNIKAPMVFYDTETEYLYTKGHNIKATRLPQSDFKK
ncbi:LPS export ABC transporter periplasmic protein LptC [Candidatus Uabimicrobium amorphum]|uniref:Lipopolysaccharide export system protein LptC n=1 Tax=Uabimicrobium amorphum TaxID=2596890 RepID=A0A5S9INJ4_UABAM|nr:LPS export ABC transporter periplasmic protein LptC [Candidatus Uabimicrobium amorphum]BBM84706.1 lipopolysaccharide export system protein LptC [Candidatus Uabimicrobium amorphum]